MGNHNIEGTYCGSLVRPYRRVVSSGRSSGERLVPIKGHRRRSREVGRRAGCVGPETKDPFGGQFLGRTSSRSPDGSVGLWCHGLSGRAYGRRRETPKVFSPPVGSPSAGFGMFLNRGVVCPDIMSRGALSLGLLGGLEYGVEPCRLLRCAVSRHLFAESPMGFHRTLAFISLLPRALKPTSMF
jgi:hypothetical protein